MKDVKSLLDLYNDIDGDFELPLDHYEKCDVHGEYQSMKVVNGFSVVINPMCPSCKAEARIKSIMGRSGIQKRFLNCTFKGYEIKSEKQKEIRFTLYSFAKNFKRSIEDGTSLVLSGSVGTGKTHLACAVANYIARHGYSSYFGTVSTILNSAKSTWKREVNKTEAQVIQEYIDIDLLIIDEVGMTKDDAGDDRILFDIINGRYEEQKPMILITNLNQEEFIKKVGPRVYDRLNHGGGFLTLDWESYRS